MSMDRIADHNSGRRGVLKLGFLLLALSMPAVRADFVDPILTPEPLAIPAGMPPAEVEKVIMWTGRHRLWKVQAREPDAVVLTLVRTGCSAHPNYNHWIRLLVNDFGAEFSAWSMSR